MKPPTTIADRRLRLRRCADGAGLRLALAIVCTALWLAPISANAQAVWTGATSTDWANSANWVNSGPPGGSGSGQFSSTTSNSPNVGSPASVGKLYFTTQTNALTFAGTGGLTLNGISGIGIDNKASAANSPTFSAALPITVGASQTWQATNTSSGSLTFAGAIALGANTLTLKPNGAVNTVGVSGAISGSGNIVSAGSGTVTLSGTNSSFSGTTTIGSGSVLRATTNAQALGAGAASISLGGGNGDGATLQLANNAGLNFARNLTLNASTAAAYSTLVSDVITPGGAAVTHTLGNLNMGNNQILMVNRGSNVGSGTAGIAFSGTTTLSASGSPLGLGSTFLVGSGAQLSLGAVTGTNINVEFMGDGNTSVTGVIGTGSGRLTKMGTGTLTLSGNNTYTGPTNIGGGVLQLGSAGSGGFTPLGTTATGTTIYTSGALDLNGITLSTAEGLTINGGGFNSAGTLINTGAAATYSGAVTLGSAATVGGSGNITLSNATPLTGNFLLTKTGSNDLTISNSSGARTGGLQINAGSVSFGSTTAIGATTQTIALNGGTLDLKTASSVGAYPVSVLSNSTIASNLAANGPGITHTLGALTIGNSTLTATSGANVGSGTAGLTFGATTLTGNATFNVTNGVSSSTLLTLGALNDGGGARTLTKTGNGTLTLVDNATSLVNGTAINVNAGTLNSNTATALGSLANVTVQGTGATLGVGASQTVGALNGAGSGTVSLGVNTLTVGSTNNLDSNFTGTITGSGGLTKAGNGTLTVAGNNTYTGTTTISAGTFKLGSAGNATSTPLGTAGAGSNTTVSSGGALDLNGFSLANTGTFEGLTISGTGVRSTGALTNTGATATWNGTVDLGAATSIGGTGNIVLAGVVSGANTLTKEGTNTLTLQAANTNSGAVFINHGGLNLTGSGTMTAAGANVTVNSGGTLTLNDSGGNLARLNSTATFTANGGIINYTPATSGTTTQTIGAFALNGGVTLNTTSTAGTASTLAFGAFTRTTGGTMTFSGDANFGAAKGLVTFSTPPASISGVLPWAVVTKDGGATYDFANYASGIVAQTAYQTGAQSTWTGTGIEARPSADQTLGGSRTLNVLVLDTGIDVTLGANNLNLGNGTSNPGAILQTGGTSVISGSTGNLTYVGREAIFHVFGNLSVSSPLTGTAGLTKSGNDTGTLTLSAANSGLSGAVELNQGVLRAVTNATALGAVSGNLILNGGTLELAANVATAFRTSGTTTLNNDATIRSDVQTSNPGVTHTLSSLAMGSASNPSVTLNIERGGLATGSTSAITFGTTTLAGSGSTFNVASNANLNLGAVNGNTFSFTVDGAGSTAITGVINTTSGGLTKNGTGTLTLSGANLYTGTTAINAGTLAISANDRLGVTPVVIDGGTLSLNTFTDTVGAVTLRSGNITGTGAGALTGSSYSVESGSVSAILAGTGIALTKTTGGTTILSGANTYTGATTITGGTLQIGTGGTSGSISASSAISNYGSLSFNRSNGITVANTISGGGSIAQDGTGSTTLSGSNTGFTGAVNVNAGTLALAHSNAIGNANTSNVTVSTNAALALQGGSTVINGGMLSLAGTGASSSGALFSNGGNNRYSGNITLSNHGTISAGTTASTTFNIGADVVSLYSRTILSNPNLDPPTVPNSILLNGFNLTLGGGASTTLYINSQISGTGNLIVDTSGTAYLDAYQNTYNGTTTINNGTLTIINNLGNSFPNDTNEINYFIIPGNVTVGNSSGAAGTAILNQQPTGTLGSELINFRSSLTINSDGRYNLGSSQSIQQLNLNGGQVDLGTTGNLFLNDTVTVTGINNVTSQITGTGVGQGLSLSIHNPANLADRVFNVGSGGGALNTTNGDLAVSARVTQGSLTKTGDGIMVMSGDNSTGYAGTTTVNQGILRITHANALGTGSGAESDSTIVNGNGTTNGTLQLAGGVTVAGEKLTLNSSGFGNAGALQNYSGNNTWNGSVFLGSSARINADLGTSLTIGGTTSAEFYTSNLLTVGGSGNTTISGAINTSNGGLTKDGTGTLTLSGSNGFAGATSVTLGTVSVQNNSGLGSTAAGTTVTSGAELQLSNVANGNLTIGSESLTISGAGVGSTQGALRNVAGDNSFGGAITLGLASTIKSDANTLSLTGGISSNQFNLTVNGAGNTTVSAAINLDVLSSGTRGNLTKGNAGELTFASGSALTGTVGKIDLTGGKINVGSGSTTTLNATEFDAAGGTTLTIASGGMVVVNQATGTTSAFSGAMAGAGEFKFTGADPTSVLAFDTSFSAPGLTLTLGGGKLSLLSGVHLEFGTIKITGDTILDFGNSTATWLTSAALVINAGVTVTVNNWISISGNTAASDIWYANSTINSGTLGGTDIVGGTPLSQIVFSNPSYSGLTTTWVSGNHSGWFNHEIRPTPEPATYGAIFLSGCLGLLGWRRFRTRQKATAVTKA